MNRDGSGSESDRCSCSDSLIALFSSLHVTLTRVTSFASFPNIFVYV